MSTAPRRRRRPAAPPSLSPVQVKLQRDLSAECRRFEERINVRDRERARKFNDQVINCPGFTEVLAAGASYEQAWGLFEKLFACNFSGLNIGIGNRNPAKAVDPKAAVESRNLIAAAKVKENSLLEQLKSLRPSMASHIDTLRNILAWPASPPGVPIMVPRFVLNSPHLGKHTGRGGNAGRWRGLIVRELNDSLPAALPASKRANIIADLLAIVGDTDADIERIKRILSVRRPPAHQPKQ